MSEVDAWANGDSIPQLGRGHFPICSLSKDKMIDIVTWDPGKTNWLQLCLVTTVPGFRASEIVYCPARTWLLPGVSPNSLFKNDSKIYSHKLKNE